jgi:cold shock CspA family protein
MSEQTKKQLGLLSRLFPERGFGFLKPATIDFVGRVVPINARDRGADVFIHQNDARRSGIELVQGDAFEFSIGVDRKTGRPKAENLRKVAP